MSASGGPAADNELRAQLERALIMSDDSLYEFVVAFGDARYQEGRRDEHDAIQRRADEWADG